ncbi:MAG: class I SAM-dependent methyltransferase, partial [Cyclobacteriaceae bacterium]|nr:class I SAM-dependent methyltransferase [Cyclobacteriaceae bacterium]
MFRELEHINCLPAPFECYTAHKLWTHEHTSEQMLRYHLDQEIDLSSRKGAFIDASVEWVSSCFGINSQSRIADFGCGPGLYTTRLAKYGGQVTGIDFSKRSIEYAREAARKEGLDIRYLDENYLSGEIHETFDLIIMIMCDFCALSPSQRSTMLHKSNM